MTNTNQHRISEKTMVAKTGLFLLALISLPLLTGCKSTGADTEEKSQHQEATLWRILEAEAQRRQPVQTLAPLCTNADPLIQQLAIRALGRSRDPEARHTISLLLRHPHPKVRFEALLALGNLGPEAATLALPFLAEENPSFRLMATAVAGNSTQVVALPALISLLGDGNLWVRGEAALALGRLLPRIADQLTATQIDTALNTLTAKVGQEKMAEPRWRMTRTLSLFAGPGSRQTLLSLVKEQDWQTRLFAIRGLSRLTSDTEIAAALTQAATDKVQAVAIEGMLALAHPTHPDLPRHPAEIPAEHTEIGPAGRTALLTQLTADSMILRKTACQCLAFGGGDLEPLYRARCDSAPEVRAAAVIGLARVAKQAYGRLLLAEVKNSAWQVREAVALAAGFIPPPDSLTALQTLCTDPDARVRLAAATSLEFHQSTPSAKELAEMLLADQHPQIVKAARQVLASQPLKSGRVAEAATLKNTAHPLAPAPIWEKIPHTITVVRIHTDRGSLDLTLDQDRAPLHAAWWREAATTGRLEGRQVHQVNPTFGVRAFGGTTLGPKEINQAEQVLVDEISWQPVGRGDAVALALKGPDTGGDGLLFCLVPCPHLDGKVTVVGQITKGIDILEKLRPGDTITKTEVISPE